MIRCARPARYPKRVVNAYGDWFSDMPSTRGVPTAHLEESRDTMKCVLRDISFESFCEHHMAPIIGHAHVDTCLPTGRRISKLARVVDGYARRFQVQEKLNSQIAACINDILKPRGVGCDRRSPSVHDDARVHKRASRYHEQDAGTFRADASSARSFCASSISRAARCADQFRLRSAAERTGIKSTEKFICASRRAAARDAPTWRAISRRARWLIEMTTT